MLKRNRFQSVFYAVRPFVLERDGNRCVKCGLTLELEVHHIEGYANNNPENLATLYYFCHGTAPMGKKEFDQWVIFGKDGIDIIRERLAQSGLKMGRKQVIIFCTALIDFKFDTTKGRMKTARDRMRANGIRCEGRLPYGTKSGEEKILTRMLELRVNGLNPEQIACELNADKIPTRCQKIWKAPTVAKILNREEKKISEGA